MFRSRFGCYDAIMTVPIVYVHCYGNKINPQDDRLISEVHNQQQWQEYV